MADNSNINAQQQQENDEAEEIENSRRIATTTRKLPSRNLKQSMPDFAKSSFARSLYNMDDSVLNSHPVFDNIDRGDIGDITNDELLFNPPPPPPPPSVNQEEQEKKNAISHKRPIQSLCSTANSNNNNIIPRTSFFCKPHERFKTITFGPRRKLGKRFKSTNFFTVIGRMLHCSRFDTRKSTAATTTRAFK
mmetsp:Transcript_46706/g.70522  ORF Transcript_46706/g.70522 Transcript_46706/m.70522 type:complete len:192 (+) Transcript_46706:215-790(+)